MALCLKYRSVGPAEREAVPPGHRQRLSLRFFWQSAPGVLRRPEVRSFEAEWTSDSGAAMRLVSIQTRPNGRSNGCDRYHAR